MGHRVLGVIPDRFAVSVVAGVRDRVETHQELTGGWTFFRYVLAGWALWALSMFLLALAVRRSQVGRRRELFWSPSPAR
ncbi:MAG: hypothetical protein ABSD85_03720 [Acidimicrobiales bacterium]|jgi:choline-glycine betaine transporter